jgi:hypothetical protein
MPPSRSKRPVGTGTGTGTVTVTVANVRSATCDPYRDGKGGSPGR